MTVGISMQLMWSSLSCGSDQWPLAADVRGALRSKNGGINNVMPVISSISREEAGGPTGD